MRIQVITIFPEMLSAITDFGVTGRAVRNSLVEIESVDLRDYGQGAHRHLDDRPFGGGPGMVMLAQPIIDCVSELRKRMPEEAPVICLSPPGRRMEHKHILQLVNLPGLILLCGRYEGIDQRALDIIDAQEWSIGDYVLSGGELAAMVLIDAVVRQIPGVLGNEESIEVESFSNGLLDYVHYTRPQTVGGISVPEVLSSGNHDAIRYWRLKQSMGRTWLNRPDLLEKINLTDEQKQALEEFQKEHKNME